MTNPRITRREWRNVILFALLIIPSFLISFRVSAQETKSEELLYRLDDKLYLANVVTGKTIVLQGISAPRGNSIDWFWSPDGR